MEGELRRRENETASSDNWWGHRAMAEMRSFVFRRGRARERRGGIQTKLSADGAGSLPDSVWGHLSNSRIHHSDCWPCYWWRHESEHGEWIRLESTELYQPFSAEKPSPPHFSIFFSYLILYSSAYTRAHYAPCHPAFRFITHGFNGANHCILFCLRREHNWLLFIYWAFLNTLKPYTSNALSNTDWSFSD